jgi:hypothetical protein
MPTASPIGATVIAARPMISKVIRLPQITRLNMSRPSWSVPNGCRAEGGSRRSARFCASGSNGASCGANSATTKRIATITIPVAASLLASSALAPW